MEQPKLLAVKSLLVALIPGMEPVMQIGKLSFNAAKIHTMVLGVVLRTPKIVRHSPSMVMIIASIKVCSSDGPKVHVNTLLELVPYFAQRSK